jgi:hypothetical protein
MANDRKYVKATKLINERLDEERTTGAGLIYLLIKRAELTRRRSAHGMVQRALDFLKDINPKSVPPKFRPVFFYELGYVHRLLGKHADAAPFMRSSVEASRKLGKGSLPGLDYVAALDNEIFCEMASLHKLTNRQVEEFEGRVNELKAIAVKHGGYWGGRWASNCAASALQVRIKAADSAGSWEALSHVRKAYFDWDLSKGWDAAARQSMSQLEGLVKVLFPRTDADLDSGTGLLARSFLSRLGHRQRPEGIRDVGFGLAKGLRKKGARDIKCTAELLESLMSRTVDGTSVLWPWREP